MEIYLILVDYDVIVVDDILDIHKYLMKKKGMSFNNEVFWIWTKSIRDTNSSGSDDEEQSAEYKVKQISNNEWCKCSAKAVVWQMFFKIGVRPATLLKRDSNKGVFLRNLRNV